MDLSKLYSDRTTYPDEMTIEIQGEKMSLKEWRDSLGLKSEFTKHTQELSSKQKQMEQILQQQQLKEQQLQAQLAQAMARQGIDPRTVEDDDLAAYRTDPAFGPLVKRYDAQQRLVEQLAQRLQMNEVSMATSRYQTDLNKLKEQDPDVDVQQIANDTRELWNKGPDVNVAYRLRTEEKRIKKAVEEAEKRGYEKAKSEPPMPPSVGGRRGGGAPPPDLPKDWEARKNMALQEFGPELQEALQNR